MIDPAVERQYSDTKELLSHWNTFHQYFTIGTKGEAITPDKENQFLELKSRIAMLHDSFMDALTHNQNVGQEVLNIITRAITLKHLGRLSTADVKKMEIEWHEAYLLLNDTIAALEQRRRELADINEGQYKAKQAAGVARQKAGKFFGSFYFKLLAIITAILFATIGIQALGIYDYDELGKINALKTPYNWGKALVRATWNEDSPWPSIESVGRKAHGGWPEGIKPPVVDSGATKSDAARQLGQRSMAVGIGPQFAAALDKAVEYRKETAEKQGEQNMEIHTFRFNNAADAKEAERIWEDAESRYSTSNERPQVLLQHDLARNVNVVTVIFASNEQTLRRFAYEVYGQRA